MLSTSKQSSAAFLPTPGDIHNLCAWLDRLPLSRPKRHLARDFSDGVLVAEIVKHFRPRLVDLHSYIPACSTDQKLSNWSLLNRKVFRKLHLCISDNDIQRVVSNRPGVIESILCALREKMEARAVHVGSAGTADPGLSGMNAVRPWGKLTSHSHTTKIQDPNVDNCSLSEPLWDSYREHHNIPESWMHDDLELPNLQKKAYRALQPPPARRSFRIKGIWRKWAAVLAEGTQLKGSGITWSASSSSWRIRSKH
ncbi:uncharacterized protein LOC117694186 isoform X2 [Arvicanthis niloticus]|uniref:uncharacterized protein LOC117694186 isoform X2 n=1 Tax=Arvicanthis niloticus TaxID=61156 RepID=UPI001485CA63|nr:uncharacterized protein LOC117694186 isoform X2 [Arvicanthis niloticus]